jgi:hypothetical protein
MENNLLNDEIKNAKWDIEYHAKKLAIAKQKLELYTNELKKNKGE